MLDQKVIFQAKVVLLCLAVGVFIVLVSAISHAETWTMPKKSPRAGWEIKEVPNIRIRVVIFNGSERCNAVVPRHTPDDFFYDNDNLLSRDIFVGANKTVSIRGEINTSRGRKNIFVSWRRDGAEIASTTQGEIIALSKKQKITLHPPDVCRDNFFFFWGGKRRLR